MIFRAHPIGELKEGYSMTHRFLSFGVISLVLASAACNGKIENTGPATPGVNTGGSGGSSGAGNAPGVGGSAAAPATGGTGGGTGGGQATGGAGGTGGSGGSLPNAGTGGTGVLPDPAMSIDLEGSPVHYRVVRLTNDQWTGSVKTVLNLPSAPTLAEGFQNAVSGLNDFTNNEVLLSVDGRARTDFATAAETLVATVTSDAALLSGVYPGTDAPGFIRAVGRRAYRRPLTQAEVTGYQTLFDAGAAMTGTKSAFAKGATVVLETMLQSPHFLYRVELGAAGAPLSGYEMATKIALWLRNSSPDDALLDAAASGSLDTPDGAAAAAQPMLEQPGAKAVMRDFQRQVLHFDQFDQLSKVGVPNYDPAINAELSEASYLFFDRIFSGGLGVADVFLSTVGFAGQRMAALDGAGPAPGAGTFAQRDYTGSRLGYFTQLPYLILYSHNAEQNSILRGVSMALDVLCSPLGPPADVVPPLPQREAGQTNRIVVDNHTRECGLACHNAMINPLGFAFENYDGMGQYQDVEEYPGEMLPVDASGTFEFAGGTKSWQDAEGLMQTMASEPQTHICYAKKIAGYAMQRDIVVSDAPLLTTLATTSIAAGSLKQLMLTLIKQDAFRIRVGGVQ
jgi:hypothetical protein